MALFDMTITEDAFTPSTVNDVLPGDTITLTWASDGKEVLVETSDDAAPDVGAPLFTGSTGYSYAVSSTGTSFTVGDVPLGSKWGIYLRRLGSPVKGTVNVKQRTRDEAPRH
jgi:hypothetical protein